MKKLLIMLSVLLGLGDVAASETKNTFPPVPQWKPNFFAPADQILERMVYYTDNNRDIVLFKNGTSVVLPEGLSDVEADKFALGVLSKIYNYHPDMNPVLMDDGNILVQYNHPAYNVVINGFAEKHMEAIRKHHMEALATSEVLITSLGPNKFDDFAMKALYGRTFMFIDAKNPQIVRLYRHASNK